MHEHENTLNRNHEPIYIYGLTSVMSLTSAHESPEVLRPPAATETGIEGPTTVWADLGAANHHGKTASWIRRARNENRNEFGVLSISSSVSSKKTYYGVALTPAFLWGGT